MASRVPRSIWSNVPMISHLALSGYRQRQTATVWSLVRGSRLVENVLPEGGVGWKAVAEALGGKGKPDVDWTGDTRNCWVVVAGDGEVAEGV